MLSYIEGEEYHGTQAKSQLVRNSKNTVAYFRDYLGKDFDSIDPTQCHASAHPQKHETTVAFSIQDKESEGQNIVTVSEVITRHIRRLASSASDFLGKKVNAAVITVPTNVTEEQREALSKAAKAAGIDVLQMISEPTAAVLAYDARPEAKLEDKIIVVADLGGTRSDIAVVASRGGIYSILSTSHDYETAGVQLDQVLIDHFAKEFIKKNKTDPRQNERSLAKLKLEAEATKKALSLGGNASCSVESLADGIDFSSTINRTRYELLAGKVFGAFTRLIEEAVRKADLDILDVDEVGHPTPLPSRSRTRSLSDDFGALLKSALNLQTDTPLRLFSQEEHLIPPKSLRIFNDFSHPPLGFFLPPPSLQPLTLHPCRLEAPLFKRL